MNDAGRRLAKALGTGVIVLGALWAYWPALRGGWLWDDHLEVAGNTVLREAAGWWKPWVAPAGMDYFPLKDTLQWLEWHFWAGNVLGYHLASLALHVLSALLVWRLLGRLFGPGGDGGFGAERASVSWGAWFGGLIFAIHPVAVESVAWISEFKNPLSTVFCLLALLAYLRIDRTETPVHSRSETRKRFVFYWLATSLFLLALLSKSTVVMFPCVLLLHAWWRRGRIDRSDLRRTAPFFALSLVLGLVTLSFQSHRAIGLGGPMPPFGERLGQAGWSALATLRDCIWPSHLASIYSPVGSGWLGVVPWLLLAALSAWLWRRRLTWGRPALAGLGWFFLNLVPVLGILPMSYLRVAPRADHFAYLSLVGIAGLAGAAVAALPRWRQVPRPLAIGALAVICAALAFASRSYAANYRDAETYWAAALGSSPESWLASSNLGRERLRQGRLAEARSLFGEAITYGPPSAEVRANQGSVYERMGRTAEAEAQYRESIRIDPAFAGAHYDLGNLLLAKGESEQAAEQFQAALRLDPTSAMTHNNFGVALARQGWRAEAVTEYRAALKLDPKLAEGWVNLGNVLFRLGRRDEAVKAYRAALAVAPDNAAARHNLSAVEQLPAP